MRARARHGTRSDHAHGLRLARASSITWTDRSVHSKRTSSIFATPSMPRVDTLTDDVPPDAPSSLARVRVIADLLDNALRIPGTQIRIGLDPLMGLIPGFGDLAGGLASAYVILEAARAGAPASLLLRMLGNVGIDSIVGSLPVAGDLFDVAWKSNARNVRLLERHLEVPRATRRASAALVFLVIAGAVLFAVGGIVLTYLGIRALVRHP